MNKYRILYLVVIPIFTSCAEKVDPISLNSEKQGGLYEINETGKELTFYNRSEKLKVDTTSVISFKNFDQLQSGNPPMDGIALLIIKLDETGTSKLKEMTKRNIKKQLCLVIEDKIVAAPQVSEVISNGQIELLIAKKDFEYLAASFEN